MAELKQYAAEPMAEVPEMKELIDKKIKEMAELKPCFLCKFYQSTPYGESCTYGTGPDDPFDNRKGRRTGSHRCLEQDELYAKLYAKLRKGLRFKWEWMASETPGSESNRKELFSKVITECEKIRRKL